MYATFAFIGLFTLGSVDAIVTGGADFEPSAAYAGEYRAAPVALAQAAPVIVAGDAETQVLKTAAPEAVDYSFTTEVLLGGPEVVVGDAWILIDASVEPAL